jgi:hypothetical protein
MLRRVKGEVFVDYVRMLRAHKHTDWSPYLTPEDRVFLTERIEPTGWYPMETFERMGLAILKVMKPDLQLVRAWGFAQIEGLMLAQPDLVAPEDPRDTLMRFRVLRASFFDFPAIEIRSVTDRQAVVAVAYLMSAAAEEAASYQTMGLFERLLAVAGASDVTAQFTARSWAGDPVTLIQFQWN